MRCRNAKEWLGAQRDGTLEASIASALQEHLHQCQECQAFDRQQRRIEHTLHATPPPVHIAATISTNSIMQAIQQQKRVTDQLDHIHTQQLTRIESMKTVGAASVALGLFTLSSIPLLVVAIAIVQTDLVLKALTLCNGVIDLFIILAQYLQTGLTLVTRDNWLLSGVALGVVIMMGMWLRLMRSPQET
jgi:Putative zinc-finger